MTILEAFEQLDQCNKLFLKEDYCKYEIICTNDKQVKHEQYTEAEEAQFKQYLQHLINTCKDINSKFTKVSPTDEQVKSCSKIIYTAVDHSKNAVSKLHFDTAKKKFVITDASYKDFMQSMVDLL